jgi:hypothetical protein
VPPLLDRDNSSFLAVEPGTALNNELSVGVSFEPNENRRKRDES